MSLRSELTKVKNDLLTYYSWLNCGFVGQMVTYKGDIVQGWLNDKGELLFTGLADDKGNYVTFVVGKSKISKFESADCDNTNLLSNTSVKMFGVLQSNSDLDIVIHALSQGLMTSNRSIEITGFNTDTIEIITNMFVDEDTQVDVMKKVGLRDIRLVQIDFAIPIEYMNVKPNCFDNICLNCKEY